MNTILIVKIAASLLAGFLAGPAAVYVFNKMPAAWLCDYGETPGQELTDPYVKRLKENPWRWVYSAGFMCLCIRLSMETDMQLAAAGLIACWLMLVIALADMKYMIIPDQFVILLALSAVGFIPAYREGVAFDITGISGVMQPIIGMAIGGGFMLILAGAGMLITHKEAVGFGDVKLCAALGLVLGVAGIIVALVIAVLASGVYAGAGLISGRMKKNHAMPMGPFICGGAMAYMMIALPLLV